MQHGPPDAFFEVGKIVEVDGRRIEIIKSLADCNATVVYFRPEGKPPFPTPRPLWPPEIRRSGSSHGGDVMEAEFDPVLPDRTEIKVSFAPMGDRSESSSVTVPVDRRRTRSFERSITAPLPPVVETDGVAIEVLDARVGVLHGAIELAVTSRDESILGLEIGWPHRILHRSGPGASALWKDWHPEESIVRPTTTRGPDGTTTVSISSGPGGIVGIARRKKGAKPDTPKEMSPEPPQPVHLFSLPQDSELDRAAAHTYAQRAPPLSARLRISHAPPPPAASGLALEISGLYVCRFAGEHIVTIPNPGWDSIVPLSGIELGVGDERIELLRWEPGPDTARLVVRTPSQWCWPDVRILHGEESVSLWMRPGAEGTVVGALPRIYGPAFTDPGGVRLALRLLGRPAHGVRIPIALSPSQV